ncbi:MAG TPA: hypothetical protein VFN21_12825 [Acidimicrobiales bacterium]|nr:hypothetical protein [Acidimicrobiales bacterium]
MRRRFGLVAALAMVVAACVGCEPGWINPVLGSGDGSGSVPGDPPGVAAADVALGSPWAMTDLGARGYLAYEGDDCTIMRVADGHATRYAGDGTCGESGDGGPAADAQLGVVPTPLGAGLQADPDGNVYFVNAPTGNIRRIDAATGTISTVVADPGGFVFGISAEAGGVITYLTSRTVEIIDGNISYRDEVWELRRLDASGDHLVADIDAYLYPQSSPAGLVRVGPDHYVTFGSVTDTNPIRIDVVDGIVSSTAIAQVGPELILGAAGADGSVYGVTYYDLSADGFEGNHVFRVHPDGSVDFIAGSGDPDTGTKRQMGTGGDLDLTAKVVAMTRQGNLLIASGHTVYNLVDPATAPAIAAP